MNAFFRWVCYLQAVNKEIMMQVPFCGSVRFTQWDLQTVKLNRFYSFHYAVYLTLQPFENLLLLILNINEYFSVRSFVFLNYFNGFHLVRWSVWKENLSWTCLFVNSVVFWTDVQIALSVFSSAFSMFIIKC